MRIMVLGVTGMLGHVMFRVLAEDPQLQAFGTARTNEARRYFSHSASPRILTGIDVEHPDSLLRAFGVARPEVVINCVGLVKQLAEADVPLKAVPINALLPHRLAGLCGVAGARLVQVSTDCVFSGTKGSYVETDFPDAGDLYGRTKLLGEVNYPHAVTLRTSIIGHELTGSHGLLEWFLAQEGSVKGFRRAVFSGLTTVELSRVIRDFVLPNPTLHGVYHVAAHPINKYELLQLIAEAYNKPTKVVPDDQTVIDRSLNPKRFRKATGYVAPSWSVMVNSMRDWK